MLVCHTRSCSATAGWPTPLTRPPILACTSVRTCNIAEFDDVRPGAYSRLYVLFIVFGSEHALPAPISSFVDECLFSIVCNEQLIDLTHHAKCIPNGIDSSPLHHHPRSLLPAVLFCEHAPSCNWTGKEGYTRLIQNSWEVERKEAKNLQLGDRHPFNPPIIITYTTVLYNRWDQIIIKLDIQKRCKKRDIKCVQSHSKTIAPLSG